MQMASKHKAVFGSTEDGHSLALQGHGHLRSEVVDNLL